MKCPNCGASLSCGCQKKRLSGGKVGCKNCINKLKTNNNARRMLTRRI